MTSEKQQDFMPRIIARTMKGHPSIEQLFDQVSVNLSIKFEKSKDSGWASNIDKDGIARIDWSAEKPTEAGLSHELLHLDIQVQGFVRYIGAVAYSREQKLVANHLLGALDNEFQHHRFYQRFLELGNRPDCFYAKSSRNIGKHLKKSISQGITNEIEFASLYLTASSLGGATSTADMLQFRNELKEKFEPYSSIGEQLDVSLDQWRKQSNFDHKQHLIDILRAIDVGPKFKVGPYHSSPDDPGWFFVGP